MKTTGADGSKAMHRQLGAPSFADALPPAKVGRNAQLEHVIGTLKRSCGYRTVRYLGLACNAVELCFKCLAYNLRRAARLHELAWA